ncbi:hypothetical protein ASE19_16155 [Nocardioides sp. Root79]|jgi:hypothetical protein|nr:hypothetical protein ASE19_16155 [Nocardioides sp. Root79]KRC75610.1 hypothetical protein ASE20_22175 [Nocardioides sp. Root240]
MHVKSFRRAIILAVALVASTLSLVTGTTTAAHAAAYTTKPYLQRSTTLVQHGSASYGKVTLTAGVGLVEAPGYDANRGTVQVQRQIVGQTAWSTIYTADLAANFHPSWTFAPTYSASYRVVYSGYSDASNSFGAATGGSYRVNVARNLHDNYRSSTRTFYGKVSPKYAGRAIVIQKSTCARPRLASCRWGAYKTIRTNSTSNFSLRLPVYRTKTHFRAVIAASNGYVKSFSNYYVSTWRS